MTRASVFFSLALLFTPVPLYGHAYLVKSIPASRAVLYRPPARIQLWFNERLELRYSSLTLSEESGTPVELGEVEVIGQDRKLLSAAVKNLPPGRYVIRYRVLSVDGHIVRDQITFTVKQ